MQVLSILEASLMFLRPREAKRKITSAANFQPKNVSFRYNATSTLFVHNPYETESRRHSTLHCLYKFDKKSSTVDLSNVKATH